MSSNRMVTVGSVGLNGLPLTLPLPLSLSTSIKFTLFLGVELPTDDLGVSTNLPRAGKLSTVVSSSSLAETVVISVLLCVGMISVCFMNPVKISNRSSSDILGLVLPTGKAVVTAGPGVVNLLKAGRLLLFFVVSGVGSSVARVGTKGRTEETDRPPSRPAVVCGVGSVVLLVVFEPSVVVVLRGRNGGRMGRNLFLNLNLFLRGLNGRLVGFSLGSTWLAFEPKPETLRSSSDARSVSLNPSISLSSNSPSLPMTPGNTVSVSSGLVVVDLRRAKILFLIEFLTGNLVLTLGEEESTEETVVDLAKPGLLGSSPGRRPNNGLRVEGETGAGVSVANSD